MTVSPEDPRSDPKGAMPAVAVMRIRASGIGAVLFDHSQGADADGAQIGLGQAKASS